MQDLEKQALLKIVNGANWSELEEAKKAASQIADLYVKSHSLEGSYTDEKRVEILNELQQWCNEMFVWFDAPDKLFGLLFYSNLQPSHLFEDEVTNQIKKGVFAQYLVKSCNACIRDNHSRFESCFSILFKNLKMLYTNIKPAKMLPGYQYPSEGLRKMVAGKSLMESILDFDFELYAQFFLEGSEPLQQFFVKAIASLEYAVKVDGEERCKLADCCNKIITLFHPDSQIEEQLMLLQRKYSD